MFSALSLGSPLYILSLKDGIKHYVSSIDYISPIRPMFGSYLPNVNNMGSVVDIKATIDGHQREFSNVSAVATVSTSDSFIITESKEAMLQLINLVLLNNQKHLDNKELYELNVKDCKEILKTLNPSYAKEAAMDTAIVDLTQRVDGIQTEFTDVKDNIDRILNILTSTGNHK